MSQWPAVRAQALLRALLRIGWSVKRQSGSHRTLSRSGWPDYVFAFHDGEEIGPRMLARVAKHRPFRCGRAGVIMYCSGRGRRSTFQPIAAARRG